MNLGDETEWKDSGKDGDSHEEPAEKILSKVKDAKPSAKKKLLKKKKIRKKKTEYIFKRRIWEKWKEKKGEKTLRAKKEKKVTFLVFLVKEGSPLQYGRVCQSLF